MIKCPHCGADHTHLYLDAEIYVTARISETGKPLFETITPSHLADCYAGNSLDSLWFFCNKCGAEKIPVDVDDEGHYIPLKED